VWLGIGESCPTSRPPLPTGQHVATHRRTTRGTRTRMGTGSTHKGHYHHSSPPPPPCHRQPTHSKKHSDRGGDGGHRDNERPRDKRRRDTATGTPGRSSNTEATDKPRRLTFRARDTGHKRTNRATWMHGGRTERRRRIPLCYLPLTCTPIHPHTRMFTRTLVAVGPGWAPHLGHATQHALGTHTVPARGADAVKQALGVLKAAAVRVHQCHIPQGHLATLGWGGGGQGGGWHG